MSAARVRTLHAYQRRNNRKVRAAFAAGARGVCIVAPTGAGKTVMARDIANDFGNPIMLVPSRALLHQSQDAFQTITIQSLLRPSARCPFGEPDLVIWDEAHHSASSEWGKIRERWPRAKWLGLTATPIREDGAPLDLFDQWVSEIKYSELLALGHIVPCELYRPRKRSARDTTDADPAVQFNRYVKHRGIRTLIFCASIEQCDDVVKRIRVGRAVAYHSAVSDGLLRKRMAQFIAGDVDALVTHGMLTEGFDVPLASVLIIARPCHGLQTWIQIAGRGGRAAPGKESFHLIDCSGASITHGNPVRDWQWDIATGARPAKINCPPGVIPRIARTLDPTMIVDAEDPARAAADLQRQVERLRAAAREFEKTHDPSLVRAALIIAERREAQRHG